MYEDYDPDDYEDELQRILEGRDVEDFEEVYKEKSKKSKDTSGKKQRPIVSVDDEDGIPEREDDDLDNFIENDYEEGEEPEDAKEDREDEAKEVPAKRVRGPRRVTLNPRPKLDADRLKSTKGLVVLLDLHSQIKLKGEGYEEADLNAIMFALEHWAHRLFPKLAFDDFIEKAETLGSKRPVTTFLRKIRMDLPLDVGDDFIPPDDDDDNPNDGAAATAESLFDEIVGAEREASNDEVSQNDESTSVNITTSEPVSLTEDQRELIALKRLAAIEKRKQREAEQAEQAEREKQSSQLVSADEMFALMNMDM